ncbi:MAG TPA: DUF1232 domain-containing protein [Gemmatimonadaceae bacterium]
MMAPREKRGPRVPARRKRSVAARTSERSDERASAKRTLAGTIRQIPAYLRLLGGLLTDGRVSRLDKLMVVGAIAYIVTPIDLIPDFIPFFGQVDDVYLLVLSLTRLISNAGLPILTAHWAGDISDLTPGRLRSVLLAASLFLPRRIRRRLRRG